MLNKQISLQLAKDLTGASDLLTCEMLKKNLVHETLREFRDSLQ